MKLTPLTLAYISAGAWAVMAMLWDVFGEPERSGHALLWAIFVLLVVIVLRMDRRPNA